ncbi:MAG: hypothetical protein ACOY0R_15285 [Chloroflexota bacterium]
MRNGICPKCGSSEVYTKPNGLDGTRLNGRQTEHMDYVCANCGFYESYFTDAEALKKLKERAVKLGDWRKAA